MKNMAQQAGQPDCREQRCASSGSVAAAGYPMR